MRSWSDFNPARVFAQALSRNRIAVEGRTRLRGAQPQDQPGELGERVLVSRGTEVRAGEEDDRVGGGD